MPEWVAYLVGTAGVLGTIVALTRARPEARKLNADAAAAMAASAGDLVSDFTAEVKEIRTELRTLRRRQDEQSRLLRAHQIWDQKVISQILMTGVEMANPPPLFPEE